MKQPIARKTLKKRVADPVNNRASAFMNGDFDDISNQVTTGDFAGFAGPVGGHGQMGDFWSDLRDKLVGSVKTVVAGTVAPTTTTPTTVTPNNTMKYVMYACGGLASIGLLLFLIKKMSRPAPRA